MQIKRAKAAKPPTITPEPEASPPYNMEKQKTDYNTYNKFNHNKNFIYDQSEMNANIYHIPFLNSIMFTITFSITCHTPATRIPHHHLWYFL